jgi:multidrug efflux pump subunit AcrA (membrane-fusion protein)
LKAKFAGKEHTWQGRIVRTEGEIDTTTRMIYVVAQVQDPYGQGSHPGRPPLAVGMFVEAEIQGNWLENAVILPRAAIRGTDTVYVVDEEGSLRFRQVEVYKREKEQVIITSGVEAGELICVSPIESVVDGMSVKPSIEEAVS